MHLDMPRRRKVANSKVEEEEYDECGGGNDKPGQRNAANARERARMRILSKAFSRLKTTLPWVPPDTKLSKLDTLRLATSYIAHLRTILMDDGGNAPIVHPLNLTWPFTIQQQGSDVRDAGNLGTGSSEAWSSGERGSGAGTPSGGVEMVIGCGGDVGPGLDHHADGIPRHFCPRNRNLSEVRLRSADSLLNLG